MSGFDRSRRGSYNPIQCYNCGKFNHYANECRYNPRRYDASPYDRRRTVSNSVGRSSITSIVQDYDQSSKKDQPSVEVFIINNMSGHETDPLPLNKESTSSEANGDSNGKNREEDHVRTEPDNAISSLKVTNIKNSPARRFFEKIKDAIDHDQSNNSTNLKIESTEVAAPDCKSSGLWDKEMDRLVDTLVNEDDNDTEHMSSKSIESLIGNLSTLVITDDLDIDNGIHDGLTCSQKTPVEETVSQDRAQPTCEIKETLTGSGDESGFYGTATHPSLSDSKPNTDESTEVEEASPCDLTDIVDDESSLDESVQTLVEPITNVEDQSISVLELMGSNQNDLEKVPKSYVQLDDSEECGLNEPQMESETAWDDYHRRTSKPAIRTYIHNGDTFTMKCAPSSLLEGEKLGDELYKINENANLSSGSTFKYKGFSCQVRPAPLQRPFSFSQRTSFGDSSRQAFAASARSHMPMFGSSSRNAFSASMAMHPGFMPQAAMCTGFMPPFVYPSYYPMVPPNTPIMMNPYGMSSGFQQPAENYGNHQAIFDYGQAGISKAPFSSSQAPR